MTYSEEYKLMREYVRNRELILEALPEGSSKATDGLNALRDQYAKLLLNHKIRSKTEPGRKLRVMKKRMEDMFTLLNLWQQYIDVIYASDAQLSLMEFNKIQGDGLDDDGKRKSSFASKQ